MLQSHVIKQLTEKRIKKQESNSVREKEIRDKQTESGGLVWEDGKVEGFS